MAGALPLEQIGIEYFKIALAFDQIGVGVVKIRQ
jgi:hypothetical protein